MSKNLAEEIKVEDSNVKTPSKAELADIMQMVSEGVVRVEQDPITKGATKLVPLYDVDLPVKERNAAIESLIRTAWNTGMSRGDLFIPNAVMNDPRLKPMDHIVFAYARKYASEGVKGIQKRCRAEGFAKGPVKKSLIRLRDCRKITAHNYSDGNELAIILGEL